VPNLAIRESERMSISKKYSNNKTHAALAFNASGTAEQVDKKPFIYICCPHTMQNQLLTDYLAKGTGHHAACGTHFWAFQSKHNSKNARYLILFDCHKFKTSSIWASLGANIIDGNRNTGIALFNVDSGLSAEVEPVAIERGIRGVFYEDLSLDLLLKGVGSILTGELWYSRKAVSLYLKQTASRSLVQPNENTPLTSREKEILRLLVAGKSNTEIADKLNISIHTVKTHIYNLYKKIDVPNRLQAVLWAARHLPFI
jgi:DNA-binding CsgD family transcriptional regulator